jgi:hypothetical protein
MYTRKTPWVHTDTLHWVRIGIHTYVSVFVRVCVFIHMYTCIYDKTSCAHTNLHVCVYILAYMHADFTCGYIHVLIYACVCIYIYIYVRRVYMCMCTYLHIWSPSLLVFVYMFTYMHTEFVSGIYVYICAN